MIIKKINLIKVALFLAMLLVSSMAMSAFTVNGENYPTASEACGSLAPPPPDGETPPALSSVQNEIIGIHDCYSTEVLPKCEGPGTGGAELGQTCAEFCASQEDESWSTTWTATSGNTGYCHYHWKHIDLPAQTLTWWQEAITVTDYTGSIRELLDEDVTEASERGYTKVGQTFPVYDTDQKACQSFSSSSTMEVLPSSTSGIYDCSTSPVKFTQCQGAGSDPGGVSAPLGQSCAEYCATRENDEWYTTWTPTSYTAGRCKFHWRHLEDVLAVNWGWWNGFIYEDQIVGSIQEFNRSDLGKPEQCSGNPINTATGNKYQTETDYTASNSKLRFQRTYNSYAGVSTAVGINWQSNYHRSAQILKTSLSSYYGAAVPTKVNI
ncbi:hypothetical protein MNBD_GAMMA16-2090 [hydrothermal vent metagenome]|uniref:DUF6531 domain-containing protein n=1 Tax=hydrothermal vent metagenome TaxID=652676 RepID=A0A3B1A5E7_9ZZZZ